MSLANRMQQNKAANTTLAYHPVDRSWCMLANSYLQTMRNTSLHLESCFLVGSHQFFMGAWFVLVNFGPHDFSISKTLTSHTSYTVSGTHWFVAALSTTIKVKCSSWFLSLNKRIKNKAALMNNNARCHFAFQCSFLLGDYKTLFNFRRIWRFYCSASCFLLIGFCARSLCASFFFWNDESQCVISTTESLVSGVLLHRSESPQASEVSQSFSEYLEYI